ncbi:MAG: SDR family NAD(P)-dependent oxidoreductase [Chloroflexota bacterium]
MTTTLITGATSGIGLELAKIYAQRGDRLLLVGRKPVSELDDFFTPDRYIQVDLGQPHPEDAIAAHMDAHGITQLDWLIHNAGTGYYGRVAEQSPENILTNISVNMGAPVAITHRLLPQLKAARGRVVFVSSVVSTVPTADYAVYTATKAALDGFAYNLRIELGDEVTVQVMHPGATRTDMHRKIGITPADMDTSKFPPADEVAAQIASAIDNNAKKAVIGGTNRLLHWAGEHAAWILDPLMKRSAAK